MTDIKPVAYLLEQRPDIIKLSLPGGEVKWIEKVNSGIYDIRIKDEQ